MRILSWNVNGIRAAGRKGFLDWLYADSPDVLGLQETKARPEDLSHELAAPKGYHAFYHAPVHKRGYSGVGLLSKEEPEEVTYGIGHPELDDEGRVITARYKNFFVVNAYFPNSGMEGRLAVKLSFNDAMLAHLSALKQQKPVIVMGDFNVAHEEIDLARPKENEGRAGYIPEERAWVDELVAAGFVDTFRHFYPEKTGAYSWWDMFTHARDRNVGWRIDYVFVSAGLVPKVKSAFILSEVMGSDHCPVGIDVEF